MAGSSGSGFELVSSSLLGGYGEANVRINTSFLTGYEVGENFSSMRDHFSAWTSKAVWSKLHTSNERCWRD